MFVDDDLEELEIKYNKLVNAVKAIYYGAHWTPDRPVDEAKLWTDLRDAAGFEPGKAPEPK